MRPSGGGRDHVQVNRVHLNGLLVCRGEDEVAVVKQHLAQHVALTRAEEGCLSFDVTRSEDPLVWRVDEWFCDAAAFAWHQDVSVHGAAVAQLALAAGVLDELELHVVPVLL